MSTPPPERSAVRSLCCQRGTQQFSWLRYELFRPESSYSLMTDDTGGQLTACLCTFSRWGGRSPCTIAAPAYDGERECCPRLCSACVLQQSQIFSPVYFPSVASTTHSVGSNETNHSTLHSGDGDIPKSTSCLFISLILSCTCLHL